MKNKKIILLSVALSCLFISCGNNTENKVNNEAENSANRIKSKSSLLTPEKRAYNLNEEKNKLLSEIALGISKDGFSGKVFKTNSNYKNNATPQLNQVENKNYENQPLNIIEKYYTKSGIIENNFLSVEIPDSYEQRTETVNGKILNNVKNSRVCLDLNDNNLCDNSEPLALSKDDSTFTLKIKPENQNKGNIIAVRGLGNDSLRSEINILKQKNKQDAVLSSFSTLMAVDENLTEDKLKTIFHTDDTSKAYKNALVLQKTIDILTSSYTFTEDKDIVNKTLDVYKIIADNLDTSLDTSLDNISDEKLKKAVPALKAMLSQIENITLTDENKESFSVVLNDRLNKAKTHFRSKNNDLTLIAVPSDNAELKKDAITSRLNEIGVENVTPDMVEAAKNLKIKDLEDISKIENIDALSDLKDQLKKKENATSSLLVLKVLLNGNALEVYFSDNLSNKSIEKLKNIDNIEKIYSIEGLNYTLESSTWDEENLMNTITFTEVPSYKSEKRRLSINYLALEDVDGKYTKEKPVYSSIEIPRSIPSTGQDKVWSKYDDGSLNYGERIVYEKEIATNGDTVWKNEKANLMWQDTVYIKNENDFITKEEAVIYCQNLSYGNFDDWKLPNIKELVTTTSVNLQKDGIFNYYSDSEISFSDSSQSAFLGDRVLGIDKFGKVATVIHKDEKYSARCVRTIDRKKGSLFPDNAFDNIVMLKKDKLSYDPSTRIMYQDEPFTSEELEAKEKAFKNTANTPISVGKFGDLEHATQYCNKLNDGNGYENLKGWRLANVNELFYSLNAKGSRTFQNRIGGFDYTLSSTSSYKDGIKYPWMVGNHFARTLVNNRSAGFFRCVRNMNDNELNNARDITNVEKKINKKRKYTLENNEVTISLPGNIFDKYEGIMLQEHETDISLDHKMYEISNILKKEEMFPSYTIESVSSNNSANICTYEEFFPADSLSRIKRCKEMGLFQINLERYLTLNRYGKSKLETGETYKIVLNNGINDFVINLKIED